MPPFTYARFFPVPKVSRHIVAATLACVIMGSGAAYAETDHAPPTARVASGAMGKGFNLGQMFEATQHAATLTAARAKIDAYYDRGFRTVRIPVTWTEEVDGDLLADPETGIVDVSSTRLQQLTSVIDYALQKPGLYVILNTHHEVRLKDNARSDVLERLWSDISDRFKNRDHRLMFEILNEPHLSNHDPMAPEALRDMTGRAYRQIRADDPARIILIGGNQWFASDEMQRVWPDLDEVGNGRDAYVMATFHHYHPWTFNGDNQGDYADAWTEEEMDEPMRQMAQWAETTGKGMPVFIGEWGVGWHSRLATMNCNNIRLWYSLFDAKHASMHAMPTAVWDDGGWFKIFDHEKEQFDNNLIDCIDGQCQWDGPERFTPDC